VAQGVEPWPAGEKPAALPLSYTHIVRSTPVVMAVRAVKSSRCACSSARNDFADPHGHGSLRPSFSMSSFAPPTMRSPRFTPVSDGKPLRRLLVVVKAHVVVFMDGFHRTAPVIDRFWSADAVGRPGWARSTGRRLMRALLCR
jgi:hypothetical protein